MLILLVLCIVVQYLNSVKLAATIGVYCPARLIYKSYKLTSILTLLIFMDVK